MYYLGFDIGGSIVKAVLIREKKIIKSKIADLPDSLAGLLAWLNETKQELIAGIEKEIAGVGFAVAGVLNTERSKMLKSPNINFLDGQPLGELFQSIVQPYPIKIEHDAHCFLVAEADVGLVKNLKNVFYLTIGTGIGGAWMVDGKICYGAHGSAGEVGHTIVDIQNKYDLEDIAANKLIKRELGIGSIEALKRAREGDKECQDIFKKVGKNLGVGLANIINIFDPEVIVLNGGISEAQDLILPAIEEEIEEFVVSPAARETKILFSQLGLEGGALGAALLFEADIK